MAVQRVFATAAWAKAAGGPATAAAVAEGAGGSVYQPAALDEERAESRPPRLWELLRALPLRAVLDRVALWQLVTVNTGVAH